MTKPCDCIECRIRAACGFAEGRMVDAGPVIRALGNVFAECLAHVSAKTAKQLTAELLVARKKWLRVPRVAVQQHPEGSA